MNALPAGTPAPDFTLGRRPDRKLRLRDLRGRRVILAFYPADWSPVCGDQMSLYQEVLPEFQRHDAELLGISVDGVWCHAAYVYLKDEGFAARALFVIDDEGVIRWSYVSPLEVNPGAEGILEALESLPQRRNA